MLIRARVAPIVVGVALAGSAFFAVVQNLKMREELKAADKMIRLLEAGAFEQGQSNSRLVLVPLTADGGKSTPPLRQSDSRGQCNSCKVESGAPAYDPLHGPLNSPGAALLSLRDRYLDAGVHAHLTLFVFFAPTDCPACLKESAVWEKLALEGKSLNLAVIGIVDRCSERESEAARRQMGITFPVLLDANSVLRPTFGIVRTPEKILVNERGVVILTDPGNQTPEAQLAFERAVEHLSETH